MPVVQRFDKKLKQSYFQFGHTGTKYYFKDNSERSKTIARMKAIKQGVAITISKSKRTR